MDFVYSVMIDDLRGEVLALIASGRDVEMGRARRDLDEQLMEPPINEITDPQQKVLRLLKGA